ncbi:MAG: AtpZ/AtpI family protein [Bacteroidetes bacterium]|nr:AtpZ/AtpI family protein [Bacteroidota bacterium]
MQYAGLATQMIAALGVAIFVGYQADKKLPWKFPVLTITLPLLALAFMFYKILKDSKPNNEK